jgi:hypothetical protein
MATEVMFGGCPLLTPGGCCCCVGDIARDGAPDPFPGLLARDRSGDTARSPPRWNRGDSVPGAGTWRFGSSDGSSTRFGRVGAIAAFTTVAGEEKGCIGVPLAGLIREPEGDNARSVSGPVGDIVRWLCGPASCCCDGCCCGGGPYNDKNKILNIDCKRATYTSGISSTL